MAIATDEGVTFAAGPRPLVSYPGKRSLILLHSRPSRLGTPFTVFNEGPITPNDAFFVRYHLADVRHTIEPSTYRLLIKGAVS
jgi:sulfite dehydrogenase